MSEIKKIKSIAREIDICPEGPNKCECTITKIDGPLVTLYGRNSEIMSRTVSFGCEKDPKEKDIWYANDSEFNYAVLTLQNSASTEIWRSSKPTNNGKYRFFGNIPISKPKSSDEAKPKTPVTNNKVENGNLFRCFYNDIESFILDEGSMTPGEVMEERPIVVLIGDGMNKRIIGFSWLKGLLVFLGATALVSFPISYLTRLIVSKRRINKAVDRLVESRVNELDTREEQLRAREKKVKELEIGNAARMVQVNQPEVQPQPETPAEQSEREKQRQIISDALQKAPLFRTLGLDADLYTDLIATMLEENPSLKEEIFDTTGSLKMEKVYSIVLKSDPLDNKSCKNATETTFSRKGFEEVASPKRSWKDRIRHPFRWR